MPFLILGIFLLSIFYFFSTLPKIRESGGKTNIVLLGISGNGQKPADLTDLILFASYDQKMGGTFILSLPRDIWLDSLKAKINTAYHYGGFDLAKKSTEEILNQPVHYLLLVDFAGFRRIVDFLGGVNIQVERTFDDFKYPLPGKENDDCDGDKEFKCRFEHLHFEAGWENMDGERALKYVRSRNAEGEEGTDFARNQRQQRFLLALKDKILSPAFYLSPQKILGLVRMLPGLIKTDLPQQEFLSFGLSFRKFNSQEVRMQVLNGNGETGFLYHPVKHSSGQWVLLPKSGNWEKIQEYVAQALAQ